MQGTQGIKKHKPEKNSGFLCKNRRAVPDVLAATRRLVFWQRRAAIEVSQKRCPETRVNRASQKGRSEVLINSASPGRVLASPLLIRVLEAPARSASEAPLSTRVSGRAPGDALFTRAPEGLVGKHSALFADPPFYQRAHANGSAGEGGKVLSRRCQHSVPFRAV